jgi:hypothetical protein
LKRFAFWNLCFVIECDFVVHEWLFLFFVLFLVCLCFFVLICNACILLFGLLFLLKNFRSGNPGGKFPMKAGKSVTFGR